MEVSPVSEASTITPSATPLNQFSFIPLGNIHTSRRNLCIDIIGKKIVKLLLFPNALFTLIFP